MTGTDGPDDPSRRPLTTLVRAARGSLAARIRSELAAEGFDDLPGNGPFVLAGAARTGVTSAGEVARRLDVTKQAASQLIDTLVVRGYLQRSPDPTDRRRMALSLSERGSAAAEVTRAAAGEAERRLASVIGGDHLRALKAGLAALAELPTGPAGPVPDESTVRMRRWAPIFPVRDLSAALAHYEALGFGTADYDGSGEYGFADRGRCSLHLTRQADLDPAVGASSAYLFVDDADALYREWTRPGVGGRTLPVEATPYGLREGGHLDPDDNLIRFGSPIRRGAK